MNDVIVNGGFETGNLTGWASANTSVINTFAHSGRYSTQFISSQPYAFLGQIVPVVSGQSLIFIVSLGRIGNNSSPQVTIQILFVNSEAKRLKADRKLSLLPEICQMSHLIHGMKYIEQLKPPLKQ